MPRSKLFQQGTEITNAINILVSGPSEDDWFRDNKNFFIQNLMTGIELSSPL
jgi:hypothetical protein